jgi:hypothetical protein
VRLRALSRRALAQALAGVAARRDTEPDVPAFLPIALSAALRMLETLLGNPETSRVFVEEGGVDLLLKIYLLPKLTVRGRGVFDG